MQPPSKPEDFLPHRSFPAEAAAAERPVRPAAGVFSRYVLPVVLFVVIVGVTAWVVQNMPKWRDPVQPPSPDSVVGGKPVLEFTRDKAKWDKDADAARETERGIPGHYDFPYRNTSGEAVEFGLFQPSCDCVSIEACLLPREEWARIDKALSEDPGREAPYSQEPAWQKLVVRDPRKPGLNKEEVLDIPADGHGVVRVHWNGRKDPGRQLNLTPKFWSQPKGKPDLRYDRVSLTVPVMVVPAVQVFPHKTGVGVLVKGGLATTEFYFWSATRDELNLKVQVEPPSPLFEVQMRRVPPAEFPSLLSKLEEDKLAKPHLRSAYRVTVTIYEQKDGKEMDLGPFLQSLQVLLDELPYELNPQLFGLVRGDVDVGGSEDQGKIKLKPFSVKQGTREVFPLWTDAKVALEPQQIPSGLDVKLSKLEKESTPLRTKWRLEVVVPPDGIAAGTFADDFAVTLRITGTLPRLVRIPVSGHALAE